MNGVIMPGVSAGSNQVGARVTCTPQVRVPSAAAAGRWATEGTPVRARTAIRAGASARESFMGSLQERSGIDRNGGVIIPRVEGLSTRGPGKTAGCPRRVRIRAHVLLLVVASVLPILIFSGVMAYVFWWQQRAAFEQSHLERVRALSIALELRQDPTLAAPRGNGAD